MPDEKRRAGERWREVEPGVVQLDHHFRGQPGVIASWLLHGGGDDLTLVEAGPASTTEGLLATIRDAGFDPARIATILVTHIHLDHAGAAGALVRRLPRARVLVHPKGLPHLVDPAKLLASATRIYGDMMGPLWGDVLPVPPERVAAIEDGAVIRAGGRTLHAVDTPGHAAHHYAFHDPASGSAWTGDVGGVRLDGVRFVRPPTPPPEFDPDAWRASIGRLRALQPKRLYLTHFGAHDDVPWHLDDLLARLVRWTGWLGARLELGAEPGALTELLRAEQDAPLAVAAGEAELPAADVFARYESAGNYRMSVDGVARWISKRKR